MFTIVNYHTIGYYIKQFCHEKSIYPILKLLKLTGKVRILAVLFIPPDATGCGSLHTISHTGTSQTSSF